MMINQRGFLNEEPYFILPFFSYVFLQLILFLQLNQDYPTQLVTVKKILTSIKRILAKQVVLKR